MIHNFCLGVLKSYYNFVDYKQNEYGFSILASHSRNRKKLFVLNGCPSDDFLGNYDVVYYKEPLQQTHKRQEICHRLSDIFNSAFYPNAKKRYKVITYPFKWAKKNSLEIRKLNKSYLEEVENIHTAWVTKKLSDNKTFKIMFPKKRYIRCVKDGFNNDDYSIYGVFLQNKLIGTRVLYIKGRIAYDLAFFVYSEVSQIVNYSDVLIMHDLFEKGIEILNRGLELNKGLREYKTHYPYFYVYYYEYKPEKLLSNQEFLF